jgi:hypothetical protein
MILFKVRGKQLDVSTDSPQVSNKRRNISSDKSEKIGNIVMIRTDKHFIIKVTKIRLARNGCKPIPLAHTKDYNEKVKNSIVLSLKQGMKLLIDNQNDYQGICDRLHYKYGRLMLSN